MMLTSTRYVLVPPDGATVYPSHEINDLATTTAEIVAVTALLPLSGIVMVPRCMLLMTLAILLAVGTCDHICSGVAPLFMA
jgi:hypothetical protein